MGSLLHQPLEGSWLHEAYVEFAHCRKSILTISKAEPIIATSFVKALFFLKQDGVDRLTEELVAFTLAVHRPPRLCVDSSHSCRAAGTA